MEGKQTTTLMDEVSHQTLGWFRIGLKWLIKKVKRPLASSQQVVCLWFPFLPQRVGPKSGISVSRAQSPSGILTHHCHHNTPQDHNTTAVGQQRWETNTTFLAWITH